MIQNIILKFLKTKNQKKKKDPLKFKKIKNIYKEASNQNFYKTDPPKVGILIQKTISKFSKTKNQTQKRPPKVPKNQKHK